MVCETLVNDFNDNSESSAIVGEMMSLASKNNCCIWNVLHMNPRPSNDDESKMRGHLGNGTWQQGQRHLHQFEEEGCWQRSR